MVLTVEEGIGRIKVRRGTSRIRRGTEDEFLVHRRVCYINVMTPLARSYSIHIGNSHTQLLSMIPFTCSTTPGHSSVGLAPWALAPVAHETKVLLLVKYQVER
jgi:hypothetical protein